MYFGADYYPEEYPRERWDVDARLMAEAGFNVARLGVLAWSLLEPEPGRYDFAWLDEAIALLHRHGIGTLLSTPTTAPPPWLLDLDPEALLVRENGQRVAYGSWGNACLTGPVFRERSRAITEAMARHYRDNPAVIGWQVDCEFGVHDRARCYCDRCQEAFRAWVAQRYGSLDALRRAWGTTFWSHTYSDWRQIPIPRQTNTKHNPGLLLDYARFSHDTTASYMQMQVDILRRLAAPRFITHNYVPAGYFRLDYFRLSEPLDFVGWDNYTPVSQHEEAALSHDVYRSVKRRNYWMLEQQCSHLHWPPYGALPDGVARLMTYQGIAHGADGIVYFLWRSALIGAEQWHAGIVPHDGRPRRAYREIAGLGRELKALGPVLEGTTLHAEVAIVLSFESMWALEHQPHNTELGDPWSHFRSAYRYLLAQHIPVDFVAPEQDLSGYKLVIAPALYVLRPEVAANLTRYVEGGGTLLVSVRAGEKTETNRVVDIPFPGLLAPLLGVTVAEIDSRPAGEEIPVHIEGADWGPATVPADTWYELLEPVEAEVVARYGGGTYRGEPAATWRPYGRGGALYLGAMGAGVTGHLLGRLLARTGVRPPVDVTAPEAVEVSVRQGGGRKVVFLLNYSAEEQTVRLEGAAHDLLAGLDVQGAVGLEPYGVRVLEAKE